MDINKSIMRGLSEAVEYEKNNQYCFCLNESCIHNDKDDKCKKGYFMNVQDEHCDYFEEDSSWIEFLKNEGIL